MWFVIAMPVAMDKKGLNHNIHITRCCLHWLSNPRQNCQIGVTDAYVQYLALYYKYIHFYHTARGVKLPSANKAVNRQHWHKFPSYCHNRHDQNVQYPVMPVITFHPLPCELSNGGNRMKTIEQFDCSRELYNLKS
jgi:hypothetical protein